tara:strand:- start:2146 stop:3846 length:1701 start_codon:yes stop_codon:yes gene_type:complete
MKKTLNFREYEKKIIFDPVSKKNYLDINRFEKKKYKKFLKILSIRFNKIHNINFTQKNWNKILFYFLLIHITQCSRIFRSKSKITKFNNIKYIRFKKFYVPNTQNEHRNLFQKSFMGQEKLFEILLQSFKKHNLIPINVKNNLSHNNISVKQFNFKKYLINLKLLPIRSINFILKIFIKPYMIVSRCYWSEATKHKVKLKFLGKLITHDFSIPIIKNSSVYTYERDYMSSLNKNFDKFDKFFFTTLKFSIPKSLIENFNYRKKITKNFINQKKFSKIKYICNENLDEDNLLLNVISSFKEIKSVYIEHNFLHYPFIGSTFDLIQENFDKYITSGWDLNDNKKIINGGSLSHNFNLKKKYNPEIAKYIYFVCGIPTFRYPHTASYFGEKGDKNSKIYVKNLENFFNNLTDFNKKNIWIKKHPLAEKKIISDYNNYDVKFFKDKNINKQIVRTNEKLYSFLLNSKLIILSNYSTAFLQSILLNIPVIVFLNKNAYFLKKNYEKYFINFYKVGIFQKSAVDCSKFVNKISNNPFKWWYSKKVQNVRKKFLKENINTKNLEVALYNLIKN